MKIKASYCEVRNLLAILTGVGLLIGINKISSSTTVGFAWIAATVLVGLIGNAAMRDSTEVYEEGHKDRSVGIWGAFVIFLSGLMLASPLIMVASVAMIAYGARVLKKDNPSSEQLGNAVSAISIGIAVFLVSIIPSLFILPIFGASFLYFWNLLPEQSCNTFIGGYEDGN